MLFSLETNFHLKLYQVEPHVETMQQKAYLLKSLAEKEAT